MRSTIGLLTTLRLKSAVDMYSFGVKLISQPIPLYTVTGISYNFFRLIPLHKIQIPLIENGTECDNSASLSTLFAAVDTRPNLLYKFYQIRFEGFWLLKCSEVASLIIN